MVVSPTQTDWFLSILKTWFWAVSGSIIECPLSSCVFFQMLMIHSYANPHSWAKGSCSPGFIQGSFWLGLLVLDDGQIVTSLQKVSEPLVITELLPLLTILEETLSLVSSEHLDFILSAPLALLGEITGLEWGQTGWKFRHKENKK